jgi:uncharacterized membrane protein
MIKASHRIVIDRPPEEVFAYLVDPANLPVWQPSAKSVVLKTDGPFGLGSQLADVREVLGKEIETVIEVTTFVPGQEFSFRTISGPIRSTVVHRLEPVEGGTEVTLAMEGEATGVLRFAARLAQGRVQQEVESNLARLKTALEA